MMDAGRFIKTLVNARTYLSDDKASYPKKQLSFHTMILVHLSHTGDANINNSLHLLVLFAKKMPQQQVKNF
jgi:hypothetical protein